MVVSETTMKSTVDSETRVSKAVLEKVVGTYIVVEGVMISEYSRNYGGVQAYGDFRGRGGGHCGHRY